MPTDPAHRDEAVAVVIPAWHSWRTIDAVLTALEPQIGPNDEVVVIDSSVDERTQRLQDRFPWIRVVAVSERMHAGTARNHGVSVTTTPLVAFLDADSVPVEGWLAALRSGLGSADVAGGSVVNGTPESIVGTAQCLLQFDRWLPDAPPPDSLVTCTLIARRDAYEAAGGMPDGRPLGSEDTIFTAPLMRDGRAVFVPDATIVHLNRTGFGDFMDHQMLFGRTFSKICQAGAFRPAILGSRWLAPLTGLLRWGAAMRRIATRRPLPSARVILVMTAGIAAWTVGLARGAPREHAD